MDALGPLLERVAAEAVLPRRHALAAGDVQEKAAGELVTVADAEAERLLTEGLQELLPGVPVVGEEATAADPSLLDHLRDAPRAWLVDPLDGTSNFVAGSPDFAVMVALVEGGETVLACVHQPVSGRTWTAERGAGTWRDGTRVRREPAPAELSRLRGAALTRFLDAPQRQAVERTRSLLGALGPGRSCAGVDYPAVVEGEQDFVLFWRTLPWDHAPGSLLVREAGGAADHLDGVPYRPGAGRPGLLVAADPETGERLREVWQALGA